MRDYTLILTKPASRQQQIAQTLLIIWVLAMISLPIFRWVWGDGAMQTGVLIGVFLQAAAVAAILAMTTSRKTLLSVFAFIAIATLAIEAIGTATGLPFGAYTYTELLQPQIAHVPLLIPIAWFMMLPPAWAIASRFQHSRWQFAAVSGLAITSWDLMLDPQMVSWGYWQWANPVGYFGIPWINFFGWFLTGFIISAALHGVVKNSLQSTIILMLTIIFTVTWFLEWFGLLFFWGMPGPALCGMLAMGLFVALGWRSIRQSTA